MRAISAGEVVSPIADPTEAAADSPPRLSLGFCWAGALISDVRANATIKVLLILMVCSFATFLTPRVIRIGIVRTQSEVAGESAGSKIAAGPRQRGRQTKPIGRTKVNSDCQPELRHGCDSTGCHN